MDDKVAYSVVFRTLPIPSIVLLPNAPLFTIVDANDAYLNLLTKSREELLGKSFFEIFPSNPYLTDNEWKNSFDTILQEKKSHKVPPQKYAFPIATSPPRIDIKYLEIQQTPILDEQGEIRFIIRSMTDVTESTHYDKFLQDTQQVGHIGSWELNIAHQTVFWSQGLREIFEVDPDYQPDFDSGLAFYTNENDRKELTLAFEKTLQDGAVFHTTLPILTAKGRTRWIFTEGRADLVNGTCVRVHGISQDITEKKHQNDALVASEHKFQNLVQTIDGIVWEADAQTYKITFISGKVEQILGYTAEDWLADDSFWLNHIIEADREHAARHYYLKEKNQFLENQTFDYRMIKKDGGIVWIKDIVSVIYEADVPRWFRGIMVDITETKRLADLDHLEKTVLELNEQQQTSLTQVLSSYLTGIESLFPGMYCSIHRIQDNSLHSWVIPSLPGTYLQTIDNLAIGENTGSCGTAAYLKRPVIVNDIATDVRWADYKHLALAYDLKACWSYPIIDSGGNVMAVLSMYYKQVQSPKPEELAMVDRISSLLKVIIENRLNADLAHETAAMIRQTQELARFGIWQRDLETHRVSWSDTLYDIYGVNAKRIIPSFENYLQRVHIDDRQHVVDLVRQIQETGEDTVFEERIVRPNGEIRHLRSWVRLIGTNDASKKMIGASLDITDTKLAEQKLNELYKQLEQHVKEIETQNSKLQEIAWMQSHIVRAPLARIMGLVDLIQQFPGSVADHGELLDAIHRAATELDDVIHAITEKAEQINVVS